MGDGVGMVDVYICLFFCSFFDFVFSFIFWLFTGCLFVGYSLFTDLCWAVYKNVKLLVRFRCSTSQAFGDGKKNQKCKIAPFINKCEVSIFFYIFIFGKLYQIKKRKYFSNISGYIVNFVNS